MMEVEPSQPPCAEIHGDTHQASITEDNDLSTRQLELEQLAAQATERMKDALAAINQVIKSPEPRTPLPRHVPGLPFHPRTGKIRRPRDQDSSDDEFFCVQEDSDDDSHSRGHISEGRVTSPHTLPKARSVKRGRPPSSKPAPIDVPWVSNANGKYGINKPKCPPCARLKKADPCNGQAPCAQCFRKGRRTPEECQEWGENYVPKIRKKRAARGSLKRV